MPLVFKTLKTFFLAKTRYRYYRIHTSIPPYLQTPPCGMHVIVVGCAQPPPPGQANTPPPPPSRRPPPPPPPQVLTDSWGGCRIRTSRCRPPGFGPLPPHVPRFSRLNIRKVGHAVLYLQAGSTCVKRHIFATCSLQYGSIFKMEITTRNSNSSHGGPRIVFCVSPSLTSGSL